MVRAIGDPITGPDQTFKHYFWNTTPLFWQMALLENLTAPIQKHAGTYFDNPPHSKTHQCPFNNLHPFTKPPAPFQQLAPIWNPLTPFQNPHPCPFNNPAPFQQLEPIQNPTPTLSKTKCHLFGNHHPFKNKLLACKLGDPNTCLYHPHPPFFLIYIPMYFNVINKSINENLFILKSLKFPKGTYLLFFEHLKWTCDLLHLDSRWSPGDIMIIKYSRWSKVKYTESSLIYNKHSCITPFPPTTNFSNHCCHCYHHLALWMPIWAKQGC